MGFEGVYITRTCFPDVSEFLIAIAMQSNNEGDYAKHPVHRECSDEAARSPEPSLVVKYDQYRLLLVRYPDQYESSSEVFVIIPLTTSVAKNDGY